MGKNVRRRIKKNKEKRRGRGGKKDMTERKGREKGERKG